MKPASFKSIGSHFSNTAEVPRGKEYFYRCLACGEVIPSEPRDNVGCSCGSIFIDRDCWRLIADDLAVLEVLQKVR